MEAAYLSPESVLDIARHGGGARCQGGVLFTLGMTSPSGRYAAGAPGARQARSRDETLRLSRSFRRPRPRKDRDCCLHLNPGLMDEAWTRRIARRFGIARHHAGNGLGAALGGVAARISALRTSIPSARLCDDRRGRSCRRAVHYGYLDRHRRDAPRAPRGAARHPRFPRTPWAHPGSDHPEFPRQARHADGRRARALARGANLDHRGCPAHLRIGDEYPDAAQSSPRRARFPHPLRHQ